MKKLIIAAAIICATVASQAATVSWSESSGLYSDGDYNILTEGVSVYLVLTATGDQESLAGKVIANGVGAAATWLGSNAAAQGTIPDGTSLAVNGAAIINSAVLTEGASAYFAIIEGDNIYVSDDALLGYDSLAGGGVGEYSAMFDEQMLSASAAQTSFAGNSAWYTQAVPEPTSGLLLLLGVAGLALRRRRA